MTASTSASLETARLTNSRLPSIDILRGLVMVIMALDHTRDFFSNASFDPMDLTKTTPELYFTRWITHFCAPVFVLLAGTGASLSLSSGRNRCELARFLFTRGLWLMFLEVAVVSPLGWSMSWELAFTRLQVIWVIGASMIILAALVYSFPPRWIASVGLVMVLGHNLFDGAHVAWLGEFGGTWKALHSVNIVRPFPHHVVASLYPVIPWVGVMALGFGVGELMTRRTERRNRLLLALGMLITAFFVVLRASNFYGDPQHWTAQPSGLYTLLSFLNCTKYPPSLLYLSMTLGPAMCFLSFADRLPVGIKTPLTVFGRVPLFYYLLHLPLLHFMAVLFSWLRYGAAGWLFQDSFAAKGSGHPFPNGYGYDLWAVYLVWIAAVAILYPLCVWFGQVKRKHRHPVLSYL